MGLMSTYLTAALPALDLIAMGALGWLLLCQPEILENIKGVVPELIRKVGSTNIKRGHWSWGIISVCTADKPAQAE